MKIELTEQQFRYLLDLVYIGNWVINSTRENDRIQEYDQVESLIFSHCLHHKMSKLVELYRGELIPSRAFADGGIHEAIEQYEDVVFYEILAEELALRDMDGEPLTRENYGELMERIDAYLSEFDEHGQPLCGPAVRRKARRPGTGEVSLQACFKEQKEKKEQRDHG